VKFAPSDCGRCFFAFVRHQNYACQRGGSFQKSSFMQLLHYLDSLGQFSTILANSAN